MKLKVFTVLNSEFRNNERSFGFDCLFESANKNKLPFIVVMNNKRYDGSYFAKLLPMIDFVNCCESDDLILFTDAFDCLILDDEQTIIENFLKTNTKVLISGESFCWPYDSLINPITNKIDEYIKTGYYPTNQIIPNNLFKYPCAGLVMGYKSHLLYRLNRWKEILEKKVFPNSNLADFNFLSKSDQGAATLDFVKNDGDDYKIDIYPNVFFNHFNIEKDFIRFENGNVLYNKHTNQKFPSIIHFNSSTQKYMNDFKKSIHLSTLKINVDINNKLLNLNFPVDIDSNIHVEIFDKKQRLEYETNFNKIDKNIIYWLSTNLISNNEPITIVMKCEGYIFYKKEIN